ncbi:hypothetical protein QAD02_017782 [Eretmocerus hayati]|uniref:Uncharacterized protein n=1 Tax=Eretmocerus hayati TaxID=131215 RepID=A0ACC2PJN4_9HYME|nr:hypothetical protein QAD02_017782 [Eretmocerus hayati]
MNSGNGKMLPRHGSWAEYKNSSHKPVVLSMKFQRKRPISTVQQGDQSSLRPESGPSAKTRSPSSPSDPVHDDNISRPENIEALRRTLENSPQGESKSKTTTHSEASSTGTVDGVCDLEARVRAIVGSPLNVQNQHSLPVEAVLMQQPKPYPPNEYILAFHFDTVKKLWCDKIFSDVTLISSSGQEFRAHKFVLAARSQTFLEMMREPDAKEIPVRDMTDDVLGGILMHIYFGCIPKIISDNVVKFFRASEKFKLQGLKDQCIKVCQKTELKLDNALDILVISIDNNLTELKDQATAFLHQNIENVMETDSYTNMKESHATLMLKLLESYIKQKPSRG